MRTLKLRLTASEGGLAWAKVRGKIVANFSPHDFSYRFSEYLHIQLCPYVAPR